MLPFFSRVIYVNRLELGNLPATGPVRQYHLSGLALSGFQVTIALSISARIIAFFVGSLFGILRTAPNRWLSSIGTCYVELFRNVPLIVQFFTGTGGAGAAAGKHRHVV